ncbi:MAG: class I adenylate-forming enzyme family protein [Chloroflexota bacterium]|nr:class I adenylate-forming enzyme family protein [Chloroflexota bacterium]
MPDAHTLANIRAARTLNGIPPERAPIPFRNIRHLLSLHATATPDAVYIVHYDGDGERDEWTYARFNARVHQAAGMLYDDLGVRRGDRVATLAYNHIDTVVIYCACWLIGAAVAPQNSSEDDRRIAYILRNSEAVVCLARAEYLERAHRIIHGDPADELGAPNIRQIVQIGGAPSDGTLHFETAIAHRPDTFMSADAAERPTLDDEALLVYTSGTTGAPKGVVLFQANLLIDAQAIASWQAITGNQRLMNVLPIHHVNGIVMTLITPLYVGGSVVLNRAFSSAHFWQRLARERAHIVSTVPTLLQFMLDYADKQAAAGRSIWGDGVERSDLRHVRHVICGAGTLAMSLARHFEERFGIPILHGYGLSETTCFSCYLPIDLSWDEHRRWMYDYGYPSIGCAIASNEMAIFDSSGSGVMLDAGERGEICVRGHNVMPGYFKRDDANAETFRFGWFRSGDEGFYQEDARGRRFFFITGRLKELINRGGVKFSPFDIEEVLLEIPGVRVGLAIAFRNSYYGEEVGAYVVAHEGVTLDADAIITHCRARMTFEKAPKVVIFGTDIPITTTGKYQRLLLQDRFADWETTQFRK